MNVDGGTGPGRERRLAALVLAAFAVALLSPLLFGGRAFFYRDFGRYYEPVRELCRARLAAGEFPLWMPELNCGTPVHGELVHGLLYPPSALLFAGATVGWGLFFAFHVLLAGLGARALARRLGADAAGGLIAGLAFAGSGYLVGQLNHVPYAATAAWVPIVVLLGLRAGDGARGAAPLLAAALAAAALAGEPFTLLLGIAFLLVLVAAGATASRLRALATLAGAGAAALLLASPALLPALLQLRESGRAASAAPPDPTWGCVHPVRLLTLLSPEVLGRQQFEYLPEATLFGRRYVWLMPILTNLHLGAPVLLAVLLTAFRPGRIRLVLLGTVVAAAALALGPWAGVSTALTEAVPGLRFFRYPDKYWLLATLGAALLAGVAMPIPGRRSAAGALALAGLSLAIGLHVGGTGAALLGAVPFLLAGGALLLRPGIGRPALAGLVFAELLVLGLRVNATLPPAELRDGKGLAPLVSGLRPGRIFTDLDRVIEDLGGRPPELARTTHNALLPDCGLPLGFRYAYGYDPAEPSGRVVDYFGIPTNIPGDLIRFVRHRLLRMVEVTHSITSFDLRGDPAVVPVILSPSGIGVYAYVKPLPRARLYGSVRVAPDREEAWRLVLGTAIDPERVLVLEGDAESRPAPTPRGEVAFERDDPERVVLRVRADAPGWLFLADTWSEGWRATVDGREEAIRPAQLAFRAVPVPAGESVVEFAYRPAWLRIVPFTFLAGLALLVLPAVLTRRKGR